LEYEETVVEDGKSITRTRRKPFQPSTIRVKTRDDYEKMDEMHEPEPHMELPPYKDKPDMTFDVDRDMVNEKVPDMWWGAVGMCGWRGGMEDAHINEPIQLPDGDWGMLFAVFDGHGGKRVASYAAKHLPAWLTSRPAWKKKDYKKALKAAFLGLDQKLADEWWSTETGATACVVLIT